MKNLKPFTNSRPWATADKRRKVKLPTFKEKDLKRVAECGVVFDIEHYDPCCSTNYSSACVEDEDDTMSISSFSTNATMDDNPGTGLTIDKYFYQPVGRAIEKFALKIAIRLNICHPSPAQIFRVIGLDPRDRYWPRGEAENPCDVIARISTQHPTAVPGILSLVEQSQ